MASAYEDLGLSPEAGLGKAIAKEYTGEPDAESIAKFAKDEYGYEAPEAPENPKAPAIAEGQAQVDAVNQQSTPVTPGNEQEALTKAEAEGDYATAGAIKAKRVEEMFRRR